MNYKIDAFIKNPKSFLVGLSSGLSVGILGFYFVFQNCISFEFQKVENQKEFIELKQRYDLLLSNCEKKQPSDEKPTNQTIKGNNNTQAGRDIIK